MSYATFIKHYIVNKMKHMLITNTNTSIKAYTSINYSI